MLLQEEANTILTDTILDNFVGAAVKIVKESLRNDQETELTKGTDRFYQYLNELNLEKLTLKVPAPLKNFLDMIFSKSRTETAEKKKHTLMQFCEKEEYLSPLLLVIGLFVHKVSRSRLLVDVLYLAGFSVLYSEVLKFEKSTAVSSVS